MPVHREDYSVWVVHGVSPREDYSMGGPWCPHMKKVTLWVVHGVPHREGYSMGGPWYALQIR